MKGYNRFRLLMLSLILSSGSSKVCRPPPRYASYAAKPVRDDGLTNKILDLEKQIKDFKK